MNTVRFGAHKLPRDNAFDFEAMRSRSLDMLARCLNLHATVAVVGAGCSIARGYVSWTGFAEKLLIETSTILDERGNDSKTREQIERMQKYLKEKGERPGIDNSSLMYFVDTCKRAILGSEDFDQAPKKAQARFEEVFEDLFNPNDRDPDPDFNPYEQLLKLPIWRFVTTNYDLEIEREIRRRGESCGELTQEDEFTEQLTRFALADVPKKHRYSVFHCHGNYKRPGSIIAGEADYQRWYLGRHRKMGSAFRRSIELLFESNPLLFVGYGLGDEDLLRPLRVLGAIDPERKASRPIFALMPKEGPDDEYRLQQYYDRYGLHVISYDKSSREKDPDGRLHNQEFCDALSELHENWLEAQEEWHVKPPPRKVSSSRIQDSGLAPTNWEWREGIQVPIATEKREIGEVETVLTGADRPSVVGFIGPSGCGKTRQIRRLMEELRAREDRPFDSYFYWNGHYINEGMTGIDQLLDFLDAEDEPAIPRFQRLATALKNKKSLVILDGAERLLQPTDRPLIGTQINGYTRQLLDIFGEPGNRTTVLLVGRLWPADFKADPGDDRQPLSCRRVNASRVHRNDLEHFLEEIGRADLLHYGNSRAEGRLSALVSLLNGHNYGLLLALDLIWHEIEEVEEEQRAGKIDGIFGKRQRELAKIRLDGRLWEVIRLALKDLDQRSEGFARPFLKRLAFSLNAVSTKTLEIIFEQVRRQREDAAREKAEKDQKPFDSTTPLVPDFRTLRELLEERQMVVPMPRSHEAGEPDARGETTYAIHSKIRGYFYRGDGLPEDPLPSLTLSGVSSGGHGVDPGREDGPKAKKLLLELLAEGEKEIERSRGASARGNTEQAAENRRMACDLCRDAYSILRARMEANTAPRWTRYSSYTTLGIRIVQLAKAIGSDPSGEDHHPWDHRDTLDRVQLENWRGALFLGEMVWLYNDVGLALHGEGLVADAYAVWEQAFDISRMIEEDEIHGGSYQIQILLNLSYSFLELGRLSSAKEYVARAQGMNRSLGDPSLGARIQGFQGLIHHLNGNLQEAEACYDSALTALKQLPVDLRAQSFFHKHRGDLRLALKQEDPAEADIRAANIFADEGHYPDLIIEAQMSKGRIQAKKKNWPAARLHYEAALRAARRIHCRRLEAAVLCNLARLALEQGDSGSARYHAMRSLKVANELRLGLRVSHSLVVLGLATLEAGHRELGVSYLKQARLLAERQQYWYRAREAEMKLQELGEEGPGVTPGAD
ncbi:MAG: hypothetical protein GY719_14750 [bacterium]|nr:hypothetical protein [bacterium]